MMTTYTNLNLPFTPSNICDYLAEFWIDEVLKSPYHKVWLTVTIKNNKNNIIKLIDNLPFNTSDYTDLVIVLNQIFKANNFSKTKVILSSINIETHYEEEKLNWFQKFLPALCLITLFIFTLLFIVLFLYLIDLISLSVITEEVLDKYTEIGVASEKKNINYMNKCENPLLLTVSDTRHSKITEDSYNYRGFIFKPFIEIFDKSSSNNKYFPSYFLPSKLKSDTLDFNLLEYILYRQYGMLAQYMDVFKDFYLAMKNVFQ